MLKNQGNTIYIVHRIDGADFNLLLSIRNELAKIQNKRRYQRFYFGYINEAIARFSNEDIKNDRRITITEEEELLNDRDILNTGFISEVWMIGEATSKTMGNVAKNARELGIICVDLIGIL